LPRRAEYQIRQHGQLVARGTVQSGAEIPGIAIRHITSFHGGLCGVVFCCCAVGLFVVLCEDEHKHHQFVQNIHFELFYILSFFPKKFVGLCSILISFSLSSL
jgi:hypothetical protein